MGLLSSRVLKVNEARGTNPQSAFNFEDIRETASRELSAAREEAARIRAAAEVAATALREEARRQGYDEGFRGGVTEAERQVAERVQVQARAIAEAELRTALPAVNAAVVQLQLERDRWLSWWEEAAVRLAAEMAGRLIRSELSLRPELMRDRVAELLELAAGQPRLTLRLHPDDLSRLQAVTDDLIGNLSAAGETTLVSDPQVTPGGCVIESTHGRIDGQVETQLARMAEELLG